MTTFSFYSITYLLGSKVERFLCWGAKLAVILFIAKGSVVDTEKLLLLARFAEKCETSSLLAGHLTGCLPDTRLISWSIFFCFNMCAS